MKIFKNSVLHLYMALFENNLTYINPNINKGFAGNNIKDCIKLDSY